MELYAGQSFADEVIAWLRERGLRRGVDRGGGAAPTGIGGWHRGDRGGGAAPTGVGCGAGVDREGIACRRPALGPMGGCGIRGVGRGGGAAPTTGRRSYRDWGAAFGDDREGIACRADGLARGIGTIAAGAPLLQGGVWCRRRSRRHRL